MANRAFQPIAFDGRAVYKLGDAIPTFVVISGIPASGKTTLALRLAKDLALPVFDKDEILERLFEAEPPVDVDARRRLSRQADECLQAQALDASASSVLVSWWKHPKSRQDSGTPIDWLTNSGAQLIEVHVLCTPGVAAARFIQRKRHPGHMDSRWSEADLKDIFVSQEALGALGVGKCITYRPEREEQYQDLLAQLMHALA